ncbi:odorant receptor 131-2-like [Alosa sapidissima]|uniref:odorant receptor 131-2-like n=1 Tax=Alosa sapidissima TaxID=34773 RepID=UPI001C08B15D|nr:odorant receptor 131-2-like [Alosa sapidissima]
MYAQTARIQFAVILSFVFIYINTVMFVTLYSKPMLRDTPRYMLFANMIFTDSIQLISSSVLNFIIFIFISPVPKVACSFLMLIAASTSRNAPLNLAVMSLERYTAICFPLRHKELATVKKTYVAIAAIWFLGFVNSVIDSVYTSVTDPVFFTEQIICDRQSIITTPWQRSFDQAIDALYYISVVLIIFYSYIRIMVVARSLSSSAKSAGKAHRTLLLHMIQLIPCLNTLLYGNLISFITATLSFDAFLEVSYIIYLLFILIPRCLSPLIYGLRDDSLRCLYMYYFRCGLSGAKPKVNIHS